MAQPISTLHLAMAAGLMLITLGLSWRLRLGLGRDILISGLRMTVQLLLVGLILRWVFSLHNPVVVLAIGVIMAFLASQAASKRPEYPYPRLLLDCFLAIMCSSFLLTALALHIIVDVRPWYDPQYFIPMLGMVLGNGLTGVSLAVDRYTSELHHSRERIDALLAMGATRWEASHSAFTSALRTALIPTLNSMAVMGVVSLPGMMTGQILGGSSPDTAVRYQIVIMFVIAAATTAACFAVLYLAYLKLFDAHHRLRVSARG